MTSVRDNLVALRDELNQIVDPHKDRVSVYQDIRDNTIFYEGVESATCNAIDRVNAVLAVLAEPLDIDALTTQLWNLHVRLRRIDPDNDEMTGDQICDEFRKVLEEAI